VDLPGVGEDDFVCYPRRGDSLSFYSRLYDRRWGLGKGQFEITPDEAAAYMARRLGIEPTRAEDRIPYRNRLTDVYATRQARRAAEQVFLLPARGKGPFHHFFSEFFDWNEPPLFKHFLRVNVSKSEMQIFCFAVTGCPEHENNPPVEDEVRLSLGA
jgi:hypothetical protein